MQGHIEERACQLALYIIENKATVRSAAQRFGISKSTLSDLLNSLRKKGYVEMAQDPDDERKKRLVLTPKARKAAPLLHAALERQVAALCRDIPPRELERLRATLCQMQENLNQAS